MKDRTEQGYTPPGSESTGDVDFARGDLAKRISIPADQISVVEAREVTWRDGSIGCPRPGMVYKQVLINGSLIVLEAKGTRYEYHSGGGRDPFYCAQPEPPVPPGEDGFGKT